jgi:hypothetical protein
MMRSLSWPTLEKLGVILVALHSLLVGGLLFFIPDWTLNFAGWPAMDDVFFIRQSGAFHFVVAVGYLVEYRRCGTINLLIIAKSTAVVFLLVLSPWGEAWSVPFSGITDGLMLVGMSVVWIQARRSVRANNGNYEAQPGPISEDCGGGGT